MLDKVFEEPNSEEVVLNFTGFTLLGSYCDDVLNTAIGGQRTNLEVRWLQILEISVMMD